MKKEIRKGATHYLIRSFIAPVLMGLIFFLSAGSWSVTNGWVLYWMFLALSVLSNFYLFLKNPELLANRVKLSKDGIKSWDQILMPIAIVSGFHMQALIMGLDVKYGWSIMSEVYFYIGLVLYPISFLMGAWAMHVNKHFEPNVRIQKDRDHKVISSGPYQFVRHPGYTGFIIGSVCSAFIIGSIAGLICALISSVLIILRTKLEDDTLQKELKGYREYTLKVSARLVPGIW